MVFKMMLFYMWIMVYYSIVKNNEDCDCYFAAAGFEKRHSEASGVMGRTAHGEGKSFCRQSAVS